MKRWSNIIWALAATVLLGRRPAFAQGGGASSTGSISGEVKDAQGGVLPGVTVTATSPAQIGALTAVTNEAGIYRFPSVPPGEYKLDFELAGFQNVVREGIRITLGFNAQVNVQLGVATLQETVTVSGQSPVIDTSATRMQTNYDQQMLASIPNARDMWSLLATTPSVTLNRVDVGGSDDGHADDLLRLRLLGPEPPADRRHQHDRRHGGGRLLSRLRLVRRGVHRRGRQLGRDAEPRRADAVCRQERRQPARRQPLLRLRERATSRPQPHRRTGVPGRHAGGAAERPHHSRGRQPPRQLQEPQPRRRRPDHARPHVGPLRLPEPAQLGGGAAGGRHSRTARRSTRSCSTTPARPRIR